MADWDRGKDRVIIRKCVGQCKLYLVSALNNHQNKRILARKFLLHRRINIFSKILIGKRVQVTKPNTFAYSSY